MSLRALHICLNVAIFATSHHKPGLEKKMIQAELGSREQAGYEKINLIFKKERKKES